MVRSKIDQEEEDRLNPAKVVSAASVTHNTEVVNWWYVNVLLAVDLRCF